MARRISPLKLRKGTPLKRLNYKTSKTLGLEQEFEDAKADFKDLSFENLYEGIVNPYANMDRVFEEGEIAMKSYNLRQEELRKGLATTLDFIKGAGQNIGGNVQRIANTLTSSNRQIAAEIEQQETQNIKLRQQEESRLQQLEKQGQFQVDIMGRKGESEARNLQTQHTQAWAALISGQLAAQKAEDYKTKGWLSKLLNF
jgi:hypothetical protein